MKRVLSVAFSMLMLCSLLLLINVGTTMAYEEGYEIVEYYVTTQVTVDGLWSAGEWDDCWLEYGRFNITNARFAFKMDQNTPDLNLMSWIVEFPDNTTDAEDIWQLCIDGDALGGTAPAVGDHKIEIVGHTTLTVYEGNGTGWGVQTTTAVTWADSLTTSPHDSAIHYVWEVQVDKGPLSGDTWGANPPPHGIYVAMYDASNQSQGWVAWPPTGPDNPDRYGVIGGYSGDPIPESLSLGVVVLLSSVAVAVSFYLLRKRPKTESYSSGKTGEIDYTR